MRASLGPGLALWVSEIDGAVIGSVQLGPCLKPNGRLDATACFYRQLA